VRLVLVGQPNSGKSTIFNAVVGYRSLSANLPGTTVDYTRGRAEIDGRDIEVVDVPGIYSLQVSNEVERTAVEFLLDADPDTVLVNVLDASVLARSLELTLQLAELGRPMVVALNMSDEVRRKGIEIDAGRLAGRLGVPVVETVGRSGEGILELFQAALRAGRERLVPVVPPGPAHLERFLAGLAEIVHGRPLPAGLSPRLVATKLFERDACVRKRLAAHLTEADFAAIAARLAEFEAATEQRTEFVMSAVRHNLAFELFEAVAKVGPAPAKDLRLKLDELLMHPVLGYVFLVAILAAMFAAVFRFGSALEPRFLGWFDRFDAWLAGRFDTGSIGFTVLHGLVTGLAGGIGIVVPYLLPFFVVLALLEDTGYLPRIAFLTDNLMHRIGLHGLSVVPILLGYGCSVPAVLATRILLARRDRLITAALATLVPCSARMTVLFGLVAFFLSWQAAVFLYVANLLLVGLAGRGLSCLWPEESPGMILEIPPYRLPGLRTLARKAWFRLREFVVVAWPIVIAGSIVLEVLDHVGAAEPINRFLAPYTAGLLGFPPAVGITLIFGILRKEMALVLLFAVLGTTDVPSVMTLAQIFGYTFFVTLYFPCLATFAALVREFGAKAAAAIALVTLATATVLAAGLRFVVPLFV